MTLLRLVTTPPTDGALALNGEAPTIDTNPAAELANARRRLHQAIEEAARLEAAAREAEAVVERTQEKIAAAEPARRSAKNAVAAAADAARRWAIAGARDQMSPEDQSLFDAAEVARRKAIRERFEAKGAKAALEEVIGAAQAARNVADSAIFNIKTARKDVLIASADSLVAKLERLQAEYLPAYLELCGLALLLNARFGVAHPFRTHVMGDSGRMRQAIDALSIPLPDLFADQVVLEHAKRWQDRAVQLAADPETDFDL